MITDHTSLQWMLTQKEESIVSMVLGLTKVYHKGIQGNADALSP